MKIFDIYLNIIYLPYNISKYSPYLEEYVQKMSSLPSW